MALKSKKETVITVDYSDLEQFIAEKYPVLKGYEIPCGEECGNDSQHRYTVDGKLDQYDIQDWAKIEASTNTRDMEKATNYRLRLIMNKLAADGHIDIGTYIVDICW